MAASWVGLDIVVIRPMLYAFGLSFALHFCRLHVQHLFEHGSRSLLGTLLFARLAVGNDGWFAITIHFIFREEAPIVCLRHLLV